jgi:hypothetical protein
MEKQLIKLFIAASDVLNECIEGDISGNVRFGLSFMTLDKEYETEYTHPADYDANEAGQIYLHMLSVFNMSNDLLQDSIIRRFTIKWDITLDTRNVTDDKVSLIIDFTAGEYSVYLNDSKAALIMRSFSDELGKSELENFCSELTEQILQAEKD